MNDFKSGKVAIYTIALGVAVFLFAASFDPFKFGTYEPSEVNAGTATTSVTVLNTAPQWQVNAEEYIESSTSTPTDVDSNAVWVGTAIDSNAEPYYLLICKTSSTPTPNPSAPPTCGGGGSNLWAYSSLTASNVQATSTYTATSTDPETNLWFAWICDANAISPKCNLSYTQGSGSTASPFYVNHRPSFTAFSDDSPKDPGQLVTWNSTASDADVVDTADQVRLWVCRSNDFTNGSCGGGGTYCSSTLGASNPSCTYTLDPVLPDGDYTSYGYIVDTHNLVAGGTTNATNSILSVNNRRPTVASSSIFLNDTDLVGNLTLATAQGQTNNFTVTFTVNDENSCQNLSAGPEIVDTFFSVYRSGVGQAGCLLSGDYDANDCYPTTVGTTTWSYFCSQDGGTCSGPTDALTNWTCNFPLWFIADPTDGLNATDTQYFAQNWLATVQPIDDDGATSTLSESSGGNEMGSYLAVTLNTTTIAYGSLEPGQFTSPLTATTTMRATGNVGLDQTIYGSDMCTTYPGCNAGSNTSTISIDNQKFASSSVAYGSASAYSATSSPGSLFDLNILKPTSTSLSSEKITYWGIQIPITITLSGDYTGQNTIIGVKGEAQNW